MAATAAAPPTTLAAAAPPTAPRSRSLHTREPDTLKRVHEELERGLAEGGRTSASASGGGSGRGRDGGRLGFAGVGAAASRGDDEAVAAASGREDCRDDGDVDSAADDEDGAAALVRSLVFDDDAEGRYGDAEGRGVRAGSRPASRPGTASPVVSASSRPSIWISEWVDYSSKYGMGYLLSDGSVGVYFNDSTKIILASDGEHFEYVDRTPSGLTPTSASGSVTAGAAFDYASPSGASTASSAATGGADGVMRGGDMPRRCHTLSSFPEDLKKKVTLLKHFRGYLLEQYAKKKEEHVRVHGVADLLEEQMRVRGGPREGMVFVKKWVHAKHALLFRLSNRTVQVNFFDGTSVTVASDVPMVAFVDKTGRRSFHELATVRESGRHDIERRLKYTKEILQQLISGQRR